MVQFKDSKRLNLSDLIIIGYVDASRHARASKCEHIQTKKRLCQLPIAAIE